MDFLKFGISKIGKKGYECIMLTHFRYIPICIYIYIRSTRWNKSSNLYTKRIRDGFRHLFPCFAVASPVESAAASSIQWTVVGYVSKCRSTLWWTYKRQWKMAIEIVDFPSYKMVDLSMAKCERSPEGNLFFNVITEKSVNFRICIEIHQNTWW